MIKFLRAVVLLYFVIKTIRSNKVKPKYEGQKFQTKYLDHETEAPKALDLDLYITRLKRSIDHFGRYPNYTDVNTALCLYFTKSLLKRTLLDDRDKFNKYNSDQISKVINAAEHILSHYIYGTALDSVWADVEFRVSKLFQYDTSLVHSIGKFNKNRLEKWILNGKQFNDFMEEIDQASLPKENYAKLSDSALEGYYINIKYSDFCLSQVAYNPEPVDVAMLHPCRPDSFCNRHLMSSPSIGYTLTHRLLNMLFRVNTRRCYLESEESDTALMDQICASMYREVVYLARRGFFARDLFLEHIALCATLGYEEFHRRNWFNKAASWMNEYGCVKEFRNFELNRTRHLLDGARSEESRRRLLEWRAHVAHSACDDHPSALLMVVMSHGIRHAAHFMVTSL